MAVSTISQAGLDAPITLTSPTLTSPSISGTPVMGASVITSGTAQASTSGTSIDFTSIPSWVKRITVMFNGVSTNSSSPYLLQIGSGSITTTGYVSSGANLDPASSIAASGSTAGIKLCNTTGATVIFGGSVVLNLLSSNTWVASGILARSDNAGSQFLNSGYVSLGGTLDRVRITTISGTDTFDAGSINILYE
jgi:hypothetical protein